MSKIMREFFEEARRRRAAQDKTRVRKRYSVFDDDAEGYKNWSAVVQSGMGCFASCDGVAIDKCVMADEVLGVVEFYVHPYILEPDGFQKQRKHGAVLVEAR